MIASRGSAKTQRYDLMMAGMFDDVAILFAISPYRLNDNC
jgi:hypothetical protein